MNSGWRAAFRWMGYLAAFVLVVMFCNWLWQIVPVWMDAVVTQWSEELLGRLQDFIPIPIE